MSLRQQKWETVRDVLMYDWPFLTPESIVFEVGAFHGLWTDVISSKYGCTVHAFEPISSHYEQLVSRVSHHGKAHCYNYGLGSSSRQDKISVSGDASSILIGDRNMKIKIKAIDEVVKSLRVKQIDLMQINCEGSEYELLEYMIKTGLANQVSVIHVQFHYPEMTHRMQSISSDLSKTHEYVYGFPFIFDVWQKR